MDGTFGTQNGIVLLFSPTEGTEVVANFIQDGVWGAKDGKTGALNDRVESCN